MEYQYNKNTKLNYILDFINEEREIPGRQKVVRGVKCSGFSFARESESPFEVWLRARSASYHF